jgi:hypothetical protein
MVMRSRLAASVLIWATATTLLIGRGSHDVHDVLRLLPSADAFVAHPVLQHRHQPRTLHHTRSSRTSTTRIVNEFAARSRPSSSTSTSHSSRSRPLHFSFFKGPKEPALSKLVDISADYTLANTKDDYIHLHQNQRLVCVGDVHGDLTALKDFLELAKVYDRQADSWVGGDTILVQVGDVLDRGSQELACYSLLSKLSQQAPEMGGGKVIVLIGNHEVLNAMGLFQYAMDDLEYEAKVAPKVDAKVGTPQWRVQYAQNQPARWASYEPGGLLASSLMANMKVAVQVGRTVCVHAGLQSYHLKEFGGIAGMNRSFREWIVSAGGSDNVSFNNQGRFSNQSQVWAEAERRQTHYINSVPRFLAGGIGASGPIWMRDYSSPHDQPPKNPNAQRMIDEALAAIDADRMVMGHTIQRQINGALDGKAWRVDVGASRGCLAGTPEVLEVTRDPSTGQEKVSILTMNGSVAAEERLITAFVNCL